MNFRHYFSLLTLLVVAVSCSLNLGSHISMDNSQVIYRGFDNRFEYSYDCGGCKKNEIQVEGGFFRPIKSDEKGVYKGVFKPDTISKNAIISTFCICEKDTVMVKSKSYPILEMPRPQIFLGGANLTDYSIYEQAIKFDTTGLMSKYINHPSISHVKLMILELSVTVSGKEEILRFDISRKLKDIIAGIKPKESILFNSLVIWYLDNTKEKIYLKREITKIEDGNNIDFILK